MGVRVATSTDDGATWTVQGAGTSPGSDGGFDTPHLITTEFVAVMNKLVNSASFAGAFSDTTDGSAGAAQAILVMCPWYDFDSETTLNASVTYAFLLGLDALDSGDCLFKVNRAGTRTGITPSGATAAVGPNCATAWKGNKIAVLMSVSGTPHLFTSTDGGDSWTDQGAVDAAATYIRTRRKTGSGTQLFWNSGSNIAYRATFSGTTVLTPFPGTGTCLGVECYG